MKGNSFNKLSEIIFCLIHKGLPIGVDSNGHPAFSSGVGFASAFQTAVESDGTSCPNLWNWSGVDCL